MHMTQNRQFIQTHSLVMSPLGPVGVASFGSIPWVSRMCLAAGLRRNLDNQVKEILCHKSDFLSFQSQIFHVNVLQQ